ncbi:glycosyltransferase family 87 protein [Fimbriiglobus ruber]|uniref:Putative conserved integral membrane protein n=1 Tax=Fimbriiglobus ruber TaxID=1908690 RepID=A0A225E3J0_9BACT|nr:glycosyltransferase family 87 protein [Fimbriiglobus ruber]OWK42957.1 putative conserved integral membrane protein [Fimbriiglobus ruber]
MLSTILRTGLVDSTLLAAVVGLAWNLVSPRGRVPRWVVAGGLVLLLLGTSAHFGIGLYRAYAIPRDVMQDIVAAREFSAGRPMHPADMSARIREALDEEGERPSLLFWSKSLSAREREQWELMRHEHWVQAHPPGMTLFTAPFVRLFGVLGTQVAFLLLSLVCLGYTLRVIHRELWPDAPAPLVIAVAIAVVGWDPVVDVLRLGQPGLILVALLTAAWANVRKGREGVGGAFVAVAVSLKLIPAVLFVPLLAQHRRAFATALLVLALVAATIAAIVPWSDLVEYRVTADGVVEEYAAFPGNISLLGAYARVARAVGQPLGTAKLAWAVTGGAIALGLLWGLVRANRSVAETDRGFALGTALMPLASPVAWDHYLVFLILPLAILGRMVYVNSSSYRARVAFWALLAALAITDHTYIWAIDTVREAGLTVLELGLVEPLRVWLIAAVLGWLAVIRTPAESLQSAGSV